MAVGNMVIVDTEIHGDQEVKAWLEATPRRVNDWLYELADETVFFAASRLRAHAPGHIDQLVGVDLPSEHQTGAFDAIAGVEPDIDEEKFTRGLGSDPSDWPVFVDVGTGIYGEVGKPIQTIPGHVMGPWVHEGRLVYASVVAGQRAQHYSDRSFEDTIAWLPGEVERKKHELGKDV